MAAIKQKKATKGSQYWLQEFVNNRQSAISRVFRKELALKEKIEWISPLESEGYAEYRDEAFLENLGVTPKKEQLADFWPAGGPQWDGLAKAGRECLLIEAKAHVAESVSSCSAKAPESIEQISKAFARVQSDLNLKPVIGWHDGLYQTANRIAHLHLLRIVNGIPAKLIFLSFTGDPTQTPTSKEEFEGARSLTERLLGLGRHRLQRHVHHIFIDVAQLNGR